MQQLQILNLLASLQDYQSHWKADLDNKQLYAIQHQLQESFVELHTFKLKYEQYHDNWKAFLSHEVQKLRKQSESLPIRTVSRTTENIGSGRKSLLKQQLQQKGDPLKLVLENIITNTEKSMEKLSQLLTVQPLFVEEMFYEETHSLCRLVDICRNEREYYLNISGNLDIEFDEQVTWILEFNFAVNQIQRQLEQIVCLIRKYEEMITFRDEKSEKAEQISPDCSRRLEFDSTRRPSFSNQKEIKLKKEPESCIRCCIF